MQGAHEGEQSKCEMGRECVGLACSSTDLGRIHTPMLSLPIFLSKDRAWQMVILRKAEQARQR